MAQSTTNLGKIHVFPSETLYNQFKDIIADNDLALLKDDGAYIIAANLAQNGYVKFSNGLILQWGIIENDTYTTSWNKTIIFPIKFQIPYVVTISAYDIDKYGDHHGEFGCHVYNLTQSGLTCDYYASRDATDKVMYIVIGKG